MTLKGAALWACLMASPAAAQDESPLSAIDWLSQSVEAATPATAQPRPVDEPPVAQSATAPMVTVTPLDNGSPDPVGLLASSSTGLPASLWSASGESTLVTLVRAEAMPSLPALQDFLIVLMLAEADPPLGAGSDGSLFLARVDKLLDMGALQQAQALLEEAGADTAPLFRRWFDVALLTGSEDAACRVMQDRPGVAPTAAARIFCLARSGDWPAAALTLNTNRVLGDITNEEEALLSRFLDPDLYEDEPDLIPPTRVSPLVFRMREAIGQSLPTSGLPLAFAHADLRNTTGWKAQLEAAERLARASALSANTLQALYTSRTPSASGGIWDRVEAFQRFDTAVQAGDPGAVANALPAVWAAMQENRAEVPFAQLYAPALARLPLTGDAAELAVIIGLLSPDYEGIAQASDIGDPFLLALAQGRPGDVIARGERAKAVQAGFADDAAPDRLSTLAASGKLGESLLRAIAIFNAGVAGDSSSITDALAFLRSVGLEDVARRAALQLLILDRPT